MHRLQEYFTQATLAKEVRKCIRKNSGTLYEKKRFLQSVINCYDRNIRYRNFVEEIPIEIGQCTELQTLFVVKIYTKKNNLFRKFYRIIAKSNIYGEIPKEIGNLTKLTSL